MRKVRKWVFLAVVIFVVIGLILTLPFPRRVEKTLYGSTYADGVLGDEPVTIRISGYQLNYLLRDDRLDAVIMVSGYDTELETTGAIHGPEADVAFVTLDGYCPTHNHYVFGSLGFNPDLSEVMVTISEEDIIYTAAEQSNADLQAIIDMFSAYISME